jgi:hypothetical protein
MAGDENTLVAINNRSVVPVLVHDIDTDAFLLVAVNPERLGKVGNLGVIFIGDFFVRIIEAFEEIPVFAMFAVDELEEEKLGFRVLDELKDFFDDKVIIFPAHRFGALDRLSQDAHQLFLLLPERAAEKG